MSCKNFRVGDLILFRRDKNVLLLSLLVTQITDYNFTRTRMDSLGLITVSVNNFDVYELVQSADFEGTDMFDNIITEVKMGDLIMFYDRGCCPRASLVLQISTSWMDDGRMRVYRTPVGHCNSRALWTDNLVGFTILQLAEEDENDS